MPDGNDQPVVEHGFAPAEADWVNLDLRAGDVIGDARFLPFGADTFDFILAQDILEHFPAARTVDILAEWRAVLAPGGVLSLRVPNLAALGRALGYDAVAEVHEAIIVNIYGGHRWGPEGSHDTHHAGWTPALMVKLLERNGFRVTQQDQAPSFYTRAVKA